MKFVFHLSLFFFLTGYAQADSAIYVAINGSNTNDGSLQNPVAGLSQALKLLSQTKGNKIIYLREGTYEIDKTISIDNYSNLTIKAYQNEKVVLTGGKKISGFIRISKDIPGYYKIKWLKRSKIYYVDLKALGITKYGSIKSRAFGRPIMPSGLSLYFNGKQMTLARWPNHNKWTEIKSVPEELHGKGFKYRRSKPKKWVKEDDVWMHGYWKWNWADAYVKIKQIDKKKKYIHVADPQSPYAYCAKRRYYYFNILRELDQPGEWYLDRDKGILYFYPPSEITTDSELYVSILDTYMLRIKNSKNVRIKNIDFAYSNHGAIKIIKGSDNLIESCRFKHLGTVAVSIGERISKQKNAGINLYFGDAGTHNGITGCEISYCGEGGVLLGGGDRRTLQKGNNFVENTKIFRTSEWVRTYRPGVYMYGVGNRVKNCEIYDLPHTAILFKGNEHLIEYNNIHHVCTETADAGAIYTGRDWTQTGTIIRYNYIHHLFGNVKHATNFNHVMGVYLDDFTSGIKVYGNIFYKAGVNVLIGGGRNNTIKNNIFIEGHPAIHVDARGITWAKKHLDKENGVMYKRYMAVKAYQAPYGKSYPFLLDLLNDEPQLPKYNCIENNVFCRGEWRKLLDNLDENMICFRNNDIKTKSCNFYQIKGNTIEIDFNSSEFPSDFERIPVEKIGISEG